MQRLLRVSAIVKPTLCTISQPAPLCSGSSRRLSVAQSSTNSKVYELRAYNIAAKDFGRFLALVQEKFRLRTAHSRVIGYWVVEMGAINQVFHVWEYDSLEHRRNVRQSLSVDKDWTGAFLAEAGPAFRLMKNCLARQIAGNFEENWNSNDFYKLYRVTYPNLAQAVARQRMLNSLNVFKESRVLRGAFETVLGEGREFHVIRSSNQLNELADGFGEFGEDTDCLVYSKLLLPLDWSKW